MQDRWPPGGYENGRATALGQFPDTVRTRRLFPMFSVLGRLDDSADRDGRAQDGGSEAHFDRTCRIATVKCPVV
jgi:hypothetical protein